MLEAGLSSVKCGVCFVFLCVGFFVLGFCCFFQVLTEVLIPRS